MKVDTVVNKRASGVPCLPSRIGFRIFPALLWIILSIFAAPAIGYANNATVANVALGSRYGEDGYMQIQFDLSWDNSWRNNVCRDAVWIFAKYKVTSNGTWNHCTLKVVTPNVSGYTVNPTNYSVGTEAAGQIPQIVVPSDKRGCFVERASTGAGDMDITSIKILWDWATDGLTKTSTIYQIKVFAIEMTYIPLSAFGVGAAQDACAEGEFSMGAWFNFPGSITSENAKTLYFSWDTSFLGNHDSCGMATADDFGSITSQTLPAAFPKGYNAFYLMKYEISQGQYTDFLNSLSRGQENNRVGSNITADAPTDGSIYVMSSTTGISYRNTILCPSNGNGTTNSITFSTTRPDRACNWLSWMDLAAFADWTGLRPMTELEFEKAARGNNWTYDDNEYAWGTTKIRAASTISGTEDGTETITTSGANACYNNATYAGGDASTGPLRCGIFATAISTTRTTAGAGYFGNMELSGNVYERTVSVGNTSGRAFTGTHGDGTLTTTSGYEGNATNTDWPGIDANANRGVTGALGSGLRGGCYANSATGLHLGSRNLASYTDTSRSQRYGGRVARSGPSS